MERFITEDAATRADINEVLKFASSKLPVLLLGPSGTGKTTLAGIIHERSGRPGEFVSINCALYAEEILEAELFGYSKGAFTGAIKDRRGMLTLADRGTLFLDEIGAMSLKMQAKLLKALEEASFYSLGSEKTETSDFRIISATLEDPEKLIKEGKLRFDFFQRVRGVTIELKPLSQRRCDIFPLISFFTRKGKRLSMTDEATERLLAYEWPGNTREVDKFMRLVVEGHEGPLDLETVNRLLTGASGAREEALVSEAQYHFARSEGLGALWERILSETISRSLAANNGTREKVLRELRISTRRFYDALKKNGSGSGS